MIEMENSKVRKKEECLKVEEALEKLGGFSTFQLITTLSIVFIELPSAMVALSPVLTGSTNVPFFCETDDGVSTLIPKHQLCNNTCTGQIRSLPPYSSIVQEWNLICDKAWITDTFTSIQMVGNSLGAFVMAYVADRFGRKNAFYIVGCILGISGIPSALSTDPYFYAVTRFVQGFGAGGCFVAHFNYLMEFLTPSWRTICGCVSFWAIGEMLLGLFGYLFPTWRTLAWTTSAPALMILLVYCFLPESPRWLLCHERTAEAHSVFNHIAKWNSKPPLNSAEIHLLQSTVQKEQDMESSAQQHRWKIFRNWIYLRQLLVFVFAWFSNAVIYFGLSYNMKNVHGNPYLNVFFLGLVDFPAELSGIYFSNRFGRRGTFIANLLISCVFLLILVVVEVYLSNDLPYLVLILCLCGRFFNEASWAVMACFTGESFPTVNRTVAMSICAMASALGGVVAPQFASPNIPKSVPYFVFCGLSFLSSLVSLSLIETRGKPLQDL